MPEPVQFSLPLSDERTWLLNVEITPTKDAKFARIRLRLDRPSTRVPTYINLVVSTDLLFENVQGEINNALRQLINEIHHQVVKPAKQQRR